VKKGSVLKTLITNGTDSQLSFRSDGDEVEDLGKFSFRSDTTEDEKPPVFRTEADDAELAENLINQKDPENPEEQVPQVQEEQQKGNRALVDNLPTDDEAAEEAPSDATAEEDTKKADVIATAFNATAQALASAVNASSQAMASVKGSGAITTGTKVESEAEDYAAEVDSNEKKDGEEGSADLYY